MKCDVNNWIVLLNNILKCLKVRASKNCESKFYLWRGGMRRKSKTSGDIEAVKRKFCYKRNWYPIFAGIDHYLPVLFDYAKPQKISTAFGETKVNFKFNGLVMHDLFQITSVQSTALFQ